MTRAAMLGVAAVVLLALAGAYCWLWAPWHYFPASQVQHAADPMRDVGLAFPTGREGIDYYGTLRMDLYIGSDGVVDRVEVLESSVPAAFLQTAVAAFRGTPFEPAVRYGRAVKSIKRIEVKFAAQVVGVQPP